MSQKIKKKFIEDVIFTDITSEIDGAVAAEQAARIMGDSDLQDAVDAEQAAREAADALLEAQIQSNDSDIAALQSDLANLSGAGGFATDAELQAAVDALQADINQNELDADTAIAAEETARIAGDANLQGQIDAEVSRAMAAEEANATAISAEEARALAAEAALDGRINDMISNVDPAALDSFTEVVAAFQNADSNLNQAITDLSGEATADRAAIRTEFAAADALLEAQIQSNDSDIAANAAAISAEETARIAAISQEVMDRDDAIAAAISQEVTDRTAADLVLQNELDATQTGAGLESDGSYVAEAGSNYINSVLSLKAADSALDAQVKTNEDAITAEEAARIAADSAEEAARIAADDLLRGVFVGGESYDSLKELNDAVVALEAASSTGIGGVQAELDATQTGAGLESDGSYVAEAGSNYINSVLSLKAADSALDAQVKTNEDAITQEVADREAADIALQANIDIETARIDAILNASSADKDSFAEIVALIESVDTENDTAFAGYVTSNNAALAQEVADREAADIALQANIDAEVSRATIAEGVLQTNIDQESMDRFSADTTLQGNIDAEQAAREAADTALDGRVGTLESEMDSAEVRLDALEAVAWVKEKFELVQADIDNGFITLSQSPVSGSESVFVGRLAMHEGAAEDYQVSGSQINFLNDLVGPGNQTLQVGDVIYVKYQA